MRRNRGGFEQRVSLKSKRAVAYWTTRFRCTWQELAIAVNAVGTDPDKVFRELKRRP